MLKIILIALFLIGWGPANPVAAANCQQKFIVLGGTGFLGSYIVENLLQRHCQVAVFHRQQGRNPAVFTGPVTEIFGDFGDFMIIDKETEHPKLLGGSEFQKQRQLYREKFRSFKPDIVIDVVPLNKNHMIITREIFRGIAKRLAIISSLDVYLAFAVSFDQETDPTIVPERIQTETAPLRRNLLAEDWEYEKILVEQAAAEAPELPVTIFRLPVIYGPGDNQHRVGQVLINLLEKIAANQGKALHGLSAAATFQPLTLSLGAHMKRRMSRGYAENLAATIALAITDERSKGQIFNLGEAKPLSGVEWTQLIAKLLNIELNLTVEDGAEPFPMVVDTSKIRQLSGAEIISQAEAIMRTIRWEITALKRQEALQDLLESRLFSLTKTTARLKLLNKLFSSSTYQAWEQKFLQAN